MVLTYNVKEEINIYKTKKKMDHNGGIHGSAYKHALKSLIINFVSFRVSILSGESSDTEPC